MGFCFGAIANKAAANINVQVFVWTDIFIYLGEIHRSKIPSHTLRCMLYKKFPNFFPEGLYFFIFQLAVYESSMFSPTFDIVHLFNFRHFNGILWFPIVDLICISL